MREADFLERIARRLGRPAPLATPPQHPEDVVPAYFASRTLTVAERVDRFAEEVQNLGGHVAVYRSASELTAGLARLLADLQPQDIVMWGDEPLAGVDLSDVLRSYRVWRWGTRATAEFAAVDVGITGCAFAVADTGTLVMTASPERGRAVHLLPKTHIALLRATQIRTRMGEVLTELRERPEMPSSVLFISGPSRSSDIENDLSIGVHGPAAVHVLILWEESGASI